MDVELTELEKLEVTRVDAVTHPANGFPVLLMKGITESEPDAEPEPADDEPEPDRDAAKELARAVLADLTASPAELFKAVGKRGQVDEAPDIDLGNQIIALLGQAIAAEAAEVAAGNAGEVCDIQELACALQAVRCWRDGEQAVSLGDVMPASMLMQSARDDWMPDTRGMLAAAAGEYQRLVNAELAKGPSAEERRQAASEGNALPDGSYPIRNAHELHAAAVLARSGHGDAAAAKRLIARRAKELGVPNPLDDTHDDATKSEIAPEGTTVDTVTQGNDDGQIAKAVGEALAKVEALEGRVKAAEERAAKAEEQVAKFAAMPTTGGPLMTRVNQPKADDSEDHAAKARDYDAWSQTVSDPSLADKYRQLAARHRDAISVQ